MTTRQIPIGQLGRFHEVLTAIQARQGERVATLAKVLSEGLNQLAEIDLSLRESVAYSPQMALAFQHVASAFFTAGSLHGLDKGTFEGLLRALCEDLGQVGAAEPGADDKGDAP